ncbi:SIS domain-containing protein [Oharaeibacter diazotrophicus]|uniref:Glutamine--fructose-6-phosphate transaminase n=3 Tax=Oharaeibacter diazotrophicus TaxID=1920512 RepID=A0A4R6R9Y3_9HYPH|nr:SIS domain-containing protein [Oharaeibacter diazotrophicus]TDP82754.1 glutamine--fructose-6-phosphate transaminase [Oharaeibacter diazotrophicus]BBE72484.1 glutamine-fructose-6-phosphate aminotransferase [isomerizing] [Pleomorphomonas sp. SM30]GLS76515.1 glucosamine--fructose-6-phosphate aminotransferase [Oharaeibacter diazotrophicus]
MSDATTAMARETAEAPDAVARLFEREGDSLARLGRRLSALRPPVIATCARGSSDHAAGYLKYAVEIGLGVPVASIGPSVASVYGARLSMAGGVLVSISQSGRSPDIVALQAAARHAGALTVAFVNVADSPLAAEADVCVPLHAGPETSVAATKSFVAAAAAAAALVSAWSGEAALAAALPRLPEALAAALACDWSPALETFRTAGSLYVVGRGPGFPIAQEMALKCKETAAIHAEAFSSAEVMHGPLRLVEDRFPVLAVVPDDAARAANVAALERLGRTGGEVFTAAAFDVPGRRLPTAPTGHGLLDPIAAAVSFYRFAETVSRARGFDPDRPANLAKVTETR